MKTSSAGSRRRGPRANPTSASEPLGDYAAKRSFTDTPEPGPELAPKRSGPLLFVVQQHAARRLHFDFRLELDGVLKSWAIPKGLVIQPGEKHLAVPTEDHPLPYGAFEGTIPAGQYGAGSVIVWDCGMVSPDEGGRYAFLDRAQAEQRIRDELAAGKVSFFLLGAKLKGSYALVRTKDASWLLLKHRDPWGICAGNDGLERSVLSERTVADLAGGSTPEPVPLERLIPWGAPEAFPVRLAPMLAGTASAPFSDPAWSYEPKLDGYRVIAFVDGGSVRLRSRRDGMNLTVAFPGIVADLARQIAAPMVLDGEIVAFQDGLPSFGALQNRAKLTATIDIDAAERSVPCVFYCFDLLHVHGKNLRGAPYHDRRRYLLQCLLPTRRIQLVHAEREGEALYRGAIAAGFEGMVAKRQAGLYHAGRRSDDWLKVKAMQSGEFIVGGYTLGKGVRRGSFGALVLGTWSDGKLRPVGNVGSGFDDRTLSALSSRLDALKSDHSPFASPPEAESAIRWTRPELVAEVQYQGWTDDNLLRAPVFLRLREDRTPESVRTVPVHAGVATSDGSIDAATAITRHIAQQLAGSSASLTLEVGEHAIRLTHLDKPLWPAHAQYPAVTKRDLLRYLAAAAPRMLPLLQNRPMTVVRMPDGITGEAFFQKHWEGAPLPPFVRTVVFEGADALSKPYLLCNDVATLLWLGQMGALEYHVTHASIPEAMLPSGQHVDSHTRTAPARARAEGHTANRAHPVVAERDTLDRPDFVVFDLDPYIYAGTEGKGEEPVYNKLAFSKAREVALHLRDVLAAMSMRSFVKTTGKTGLHIFVPIERTLSADQAREICRLVGQHLLRQHPKDITMDWSVDKRTGRIFLDHNMNGRGRTLNAAYSPRRTPAACVSMPLTWDELAAAEPDHFRVPTAGDRLREQPDAWDAIRAAEHNLTRMLGG